MPALPSEAHAAVQSLLTVYDPRRLRAGQELLIRAAHEPAEAGARRLIGLDFDLDFDHAVRVTRGSDGSYASAKVARPQRRAWSIGPASSTTVCTCPPSVPLCRVMSRSA